MICPKTHKQQKIETCRECLPHFQGVKGEFGSKAEVLCDFGKEVKMSMASRVEMPKSGIDELWASIEGLHKDIKETGDIELRSRYMGLLMTYGQASEEIDIVQMASLLEEMEEIKENVELAVGVEGEAFGECLNRYELLSDRLWALGIE